MQNKNKNKKTSAQKRTKSIFVATTSYDSTVLAISKSTLKKEVDEKTKKRQLRYAKKILNDDLLLFI